MNLEFIPVSVIIPCYDCNNTIERALKSVLMQTKQPSEIIMIDDNIDKSQTDFLFQLYIKYSNFNIILVSHFKNLGAPSARNTGWNIAKTKYVAFLDSDDAWHRQKLEFQFELMNKNNEIMLSGHNIKILDGENFEHQDGYSSITYNECSKIAILLRNIFPTPTLMIKRDCNVRFDESMRYVDDHLLLMSIILHGHSACKIKEELAYVYKPMFGKSGLSSNMYQMERHELIAYTKVLKNRKINVLTYALLVPFSIAKYIRRLLLMLFK